MVYLYANYDLQVINIDRITPTDISLKEMLTRAYTRWDVGKVFSERSDYMVSKKELFEG